MLTEKRTDFELKNVFDDTLGKEVFRKTKQGLSINYQDVISGRKNILTISPPIFEYNSRIGVHDTIVPEKLKEISTQIVTAGGNKNESNKINKFLADIEPQIAESDVFDELALFFCNDAGLLLHGYQPHTFLRIFVDKAAEERTIQRKANKDFQDYSLTELERKILISLHIDLADIEMISRRIVLNLKSKFPSSSTFPTSSIHREIYAFEARLLSKDSKARACSKFTFEKLYEKGKLKKLQAQSNTEMC